MSMPATTARPANPYAPPRASVRDIPDPSSTSELAEPGTRLAASFIDGISFALMVYAPMFMIAFNAEPGADESAALIAGAIALAGFVVWSGLNVLFVVRNGQSIGKKMLSIKVVRSDGSTVSLGRVFWLRNLLNGVISIIPLYAFVEVLFIFSESRQCLHDKIADTIVIKA
jgi:uncharacterized RDD family membrane protein YckC